MSTQAWGESADCKPTTDQAQKLGLSESEGEDYWQANAVGARPSCWSHQNEETAADSGLSVLLCTLFASSLPANAEGKTRTYYIGVDEINWDYAPSGIDQMTGKPFDHMAMMYIEQGT